MDLHRECTFDSETFGAPFVDLLKIAAALEEGETLHFLRYGLAVSVDRGRFGTHGTVLLWEEIHKLVDRGDSLYEELLHGLETTRLLAMDPMATS